MAGHGRPPVAELRKNRSLRARADEWALVVKFAEIVKNGDRAACEEFLKKYAIKR